MKRKPISNKRSRSLFKATSGHHPRNVVSSLPRGGIRM